MQGSCVKPILRTVWLVVVKFRIMYLWSLRNCFSKIILRCVTPCISLCKSERFVKTYCLSLHGGVLC